MILLGLLVGPVIGLLGGDYMHRSVQLGVWRSTLVVVLYLVFILFAPFFVLELKAGLAVGTLLGLLIALSPWDIPGPTDATQPEDSRIS